MDATYWIDRIYIDNSNSVRKSKNQTNNLKIYLLVEKMNDEQMLNSPHDNSSTRGNEKFSSNTELHESKDRLNRLAQEKIHKNIQTILDKSNDQDFEKHSKLTSFLIKVMWFFALWATLHWLFT